MENIEAGRSLEPGSIEGSRLNAQTVEREYTEVATATKPGYCATCWREFIETGHYVEEHGLDKAMKDAETKVVQWLALCDEALRSGMREHFLEMGKQ